MTLRDSGEAIVAFSRRIAQLLRICRTKRARACTAAPRTWNRRSALGGISVAAVMLVVIIFLVVMVVALQGLHVRLAEDGPDQRIVQARGRMEGMLDNVGLGGAHSTARMKQSINLVVARTSTTGARGGRSTII